MTAEALGSRVHRAEVDDGRRPGITSVEAERIKELERENRDVYGVEPICHASAFAPSGKPKSGNGLPT